LLNWWTHFAWRTATWPLDTGECFRRRIPEKKGFLIFLTSEASKSMKTTDRSCKIGLKQTGFWAEMTRILQKKAGFLFFLSAENA
jgi:hypothetical protein